MSKTTEISVKKEKTFEAKLVVFARKLTEIKNDIKALWKQLLKLEERIEQLEERIEKVEERLEKVEAKVADLEVSVNKRFDYAEEQRKKDKDDIMSKMDFIIGELQTMREENTIGAYQIQELREQSDRHEKILQTKFL